MSVDGIPRTMALVIDIRRDARSASYDQAEILEAVFGPGEGLDPGARAAASNRAFVRSHTGLALDTGRGTGLRMSAEEALDAFGWEVLWELALKPAVSIVSSLHLASVVQPARRHELGLDVEGLARLAGVTVEEVLAVEAGRRRMPMAVLVPIARAMGLCPIRYGAVDARIPS